jgi:glycosyltransferase involved in cell wall biosynthesis
MRIVQLNPYHFPYMGGIEHRLHDYSKRLGQKHEVIVLTSQLPGTAEVEEMDHYTVHRLRSKFINFYNPPYVTTPGLLEALKELDPDIVDFHYRWAPSYTKTMRKYDGKWVFTFHNTYGEGAGPSRLLSIANDRLFCRHLKDHRVVCITPFIRDDLIARGFNADLLDVVLPGVDLPSVSATEEDFILFTGRLVGTKGLPYLLEAMKHINTSLVICGDGPERERLETLASRLGVAAKVRFAGRVSEEEKARLMASCKMFVLPSLFESFGVAAAEAMYSGKPVVASRVGGLGDLVSDGGILVRPKNAQAIAEAVNRLLGDEGLRSEMGRRAKEIARRYDWDHVIDEVERIYLEVANG